MSRETKFCSNCGEKIDAKARICPKCGVEQNLPREVKEYTEAWYLVPFILGIIGGLIGYIVVKDDNPAMAKNLLIIGIVMSFVLPIIVFVFMWAWIISIWNSMGRFPF